MVKLSVLSSIKSTILEKKSLMSIIGKENGKYYQEEETHQSFLMAAVTINRSLG